MYVVTFQQMIFPSSINTFIVTSDFYFSDIELNHVHIPFP